jgi:hypothetical protein
MIMPSATNRQTSGILDMLQLKRSRRFLGPCGLIMVLSAPLGCLHESLEPYIVEVEVKEESRHPPVPPGQMLAGKRLRKAHLKGENLRGAMLAGTDLRDADLEGADFTDAMLFGANLSRAKLVNANFEGAMLLGTHLENAHIDGANFKNTSFLTEDQIDAACGTPIALPEGLKASQGVSCEQPTIKSE